MLASDFASAQGNVNTVLHAQRTIIYLVDLLPKCFGVVDVIPERIVDLLACFTLRDAAVSCENLNSMNFITDLLVA